jgi:hypothetical protein
VAAAFFNFHPDMVAAAVPACWEVADPEALTVARAAAAATALGAICSPDALGRAVEALPHLREAAAHSDSAGRILAGANRELWPAVASGLRRHGTAPDQMAVAELWQACTTLREHRGDGHVAVLVARGLSGCGAHVLAAATAGVPAEVLRDNRGWSEARWDGAVAHLAQEGLAHPDGTSTADGRALHQAIADATDALAEQAYALLADEAVNALHDALRACAREVQASGLLPFPNPMGLPRL